MNGACEEKDVAGTARTILNRAVEYCAGRLGLEGGLVLARLQDGDGQACDHCRSSVARQVAEWLGTWDGNVKAVYILDYEAAPAEPKVGEPACAWPIHLLVWVERKTAALKVLAETWDRNLAHSYAQMMGGDQPAHILDVQVVDGSDVTKRIGYGALLFSLHHPPVLIWEREPASPVS